MATPHLALAPDVDALRQQFEQLSAQADALVLPLSDEQLTRRPEPGRWSVAECIDHLNVTARAYLPRIDEAIADAIRRGLYGEGPFTYNWIGRLLIYALEPPPRFRTKAPELFEPGPPRSRQEVMAAFRAYQVQYIDRLRQANGLDLARARVISPAATWLRIPLGAGFASVVAHERRHLWQAGQVVEKISA
jgi:hypothetical protein